MAAVIDEVELKNIAVEKGKENTNDQADQLNDKKTALEDVTASDKPSPEADTVTVPVEPDGTMTDVAVMLIISSLFLVCN